MSRRPFIAGNWKMNSTLAEAINLASEVSTGETCSHIDVALFPPYPWLLPVSNVLNGTPVKLGAQNCAAFTSGAWTGEVSSAMLAEMCEFVIVGHSERRQHFGETNSVVAEKTRLAVESGVAPLVCVGEPLPVRQAGKAIEFTLNQLDESIGDLDQVTRGAVTIAYEPIWAIGTGESATAADAGAMCTAIRSWLGQQSEQQAGTCRILYGGSVTPANAGDLFAQLDIDGALVGGASLKSELFLAICRAAC